MNAYGFEMGYPATGGHIRFITTVSLSSWQFLCWHCFGQCGTLWWVMEQKIGDIYTLHSSAFSSPTLSFMCLLLCGWDVVASRHFHFTILALTADRDWAEISLTDLWHPLTASSHRALQYNPFYCHCLSMETECLCAWFYTPGHGWNSWVSINATICLCIAKIQFEQVL